MLCWLSSFSTKGCGGTTAGVGVATTAGLLPCGLDMSLSAAAGEALALALAGRA